MEQEKIYKKQGERVKMDYTFSKIGEYIKAKRKEKHLSQNDLIQKLSEEGVYIGRNKLSAIENGRGDISGFDLNLLIKLCVIFNCDINDFILETDEKYKNLYLLKNALLEAKYYQDKAEIAYNNVRAVLTEMNMYNEHSIIPVWTEQFIMKKGVSLEELFEKVKDNYK